MKKSRQVPATLIVALASGIAASGCESRDYSQCVDATGRYLPDSYCQSGGGIYHVHWIRVNRGGFGGSSYGGSHGFGGSGGSFGG